MSADRFLAICFPFKYRHIVTSRKVLYLSIALWFSSVSLSLLTYVWMKTSTGIVDCTFIFGDVSKTVSIQQISLISLVILLNICFYIGVACALLCPKDGLQNARSRGQRNHMKQQRMILMKILAITGVFVVTSLPYNVMMIIITVDYEHWKRYMNFYFGSILLIMSNSIISPVVYVWRYPECRYMFMAYCLFWNKEKQQELFGRLNRYNATYNSQGTTETPDLPSCRRVPAREADSVLTSRRTESQDVWAISAAIEYRNTLETPEATTSQSYNLQGTSGSPVLSSNLEEYVTDSVMIAFTVESQDVGTISAEVYSEDASETHSPSVTP